MSEMLVTWGTWVHPAADKILDAAGIDSIPISGDESPVEKAQVCDALYIRTPNRATRTIIEALPSLRVIAVPGAGLEIVDLAAATERGIPVLHGRGLGSGAVAEWVLGAMVWLVRDMGAMHRTVLESNWGVRASTASRRDLASRIVGVIGYGQIGRRVAAAATAAFGARILVTEAHEEQRRAAEDAGFDVVALDYLLDRSDIVTVHAAAAMDGGVLLDRRRIDRIGPLGYLINTSRGQLVDAVAVADALDGGTLGGAALDVFAPEPPPPNLVARLAAHRRVLLSPHSSGMTEDAVEALAVGVATSIVDVLRGGHPASCANPEVWT